MIHASAVPAKRDREGEVGRESEREETKKKKKRALTGNAIKSKVIIATVRHHFMQYCK